MHVRAVRHSHAHTRRLITLPTKASASLDNVAVIESVPSVCAHTNGISRAQRIGDNSTEWNYTGDIGGVILRKVARACVFAHVCTHVHVIALAGVLFTCVPVSCRTLIISRPEKCSTTLLFGLQASSHTDLRESCDRQPWTGWKIPTGHFYGLKPENKKGFCCRIHGEMLACKPPVDTTSIASKRRLSLA